MNYQEMTKILKEALNLRWDPVAVRLMRPGEEQPAGTIEPSIPLRHCQSLKIARRGNSLYMPPRSHACPDGSGILGLTEMSAKLRSGDLYLLFKKLPSLEIAQKMIASRPEFPAGSYEATLVAPLDEAQFDPDVVIFTLYPEQAMWLCCAQTYATGERQNFQTSGFNSACADLVVKTMKNGQMNISFGCYGARASSDINDFELYLSIPVAQLEAIVQALQKLGQKSIPEERRKIYMHPVMDKIGQRRPESTAGSVRIPDIFVDKELCNGCGLCEAFCPASVLKLTVENGVEIIEVVQPELCSLCYTCVGQCPELAIQIR
ncbi:MAG: 4Fe-4S binding protein [Peptococcaceae bacterium]|nr:4Fe-4S binding protein [Peptococcaceae bacterium]